MLAFEHTLPSPTATPWREMWQRAGRAFVGVEAEAREITGGYQAIVSRIIVKGLAADDDDRRRLTLVIEKHEKLEATLYLFPLPSTQEGEAVRRDLTLAREALIRFGNLPREAISSRQPSSEERKQLAASLRADTDSRWRRVRRSLSTTLWMQNIDLPELGVNRTGLAK
jgi:hypothetical protein